MAARRTRPTTASVPTPDPVVSVSPGHRATLEFEVTEADTAEVLGSGGLPVLGTPRLLAWLEAATCAALTGALPSGATSVGTSVAVEHLAASSVGDLVVVEAVVETVEDRLVRFSVSAADAATHLVLARGEISRAVVDSDRFLRGLARRARGGS